MISCEKAAIICNKKQYKEATLGERFNLWLHLLICKVCSKFQKKNKQLTSLCDKAELKVLSTEEKTKMKEQLTAQD